MTKKSVRVAVFIGAAGSFAAYIWLHFTMPLAVILSPWLPGGQAEAHWARVASLFGWAIVAAYIAPFVVLSAAGLILLRRGKWSKAAKTAGVVSACALFTVLLVAASAPVAQAADNPSPRAAAFYSVGGGINPFVLQRMDEYLGKKFGVQPNDPSSNWYADFRGFYKITSGGHRVFLFWDGSYYVYEGMFSAKPIDAGKWTKWLAPPE